VAKQRARRALPRERAAAKMSDMAVPDPDLPRASIRPARKADLSAIVGLFADDDAAPSAAAPSAAAPSAAAYSAPAAAQLDAFEAIERDPNNTVYVAELAGAVLGTFQLTFIRQLSYGGCLVAQIESVHVHSSGRGRGVGALMMSFAIAEARRRGALRVQLTSNLRRTRAHEFYERLGFIASHKGMKLYL
jgi:GNAT superfamily N-acetyltransferase